jgi:hypothetical protein
MTSFRQVEANRRNALMSTGPKTEAGKRRSRCNAIRHGLTGETVIDALENSEDYKAFELSVTSGFDAQTAVKRELVLRLASLLWRLRRATAIETGLLQIQAEILLDFKRRERPLPAEIARFINSSEPNDTRSIHQDHDGAPALNGQSAGTERNNELPADVTTIGRCFLRLANLDNGAFERLNRYETALWRQVGQILVTLDMLYQP